ncbi:MAG: threonine--tRNA ligase [Planctomycetota bacterium]|jgi:threonyl-tRNA synthetase|nr:threonine--tRNA ligase [Planctomycetota bacterium]
MFKISLERGGEATFAEPAPLAKVAAAISPELARTALAAVVDGLPRDLSAPIGKDAGVRFITPDTPEGLEIIRHSASHVLAEAILQLFPGTRFAYGPAVEDGFYYDVDPPAPITAEDLPKIEKAMQKIVKADRPFVRRELTRAEAEAKYAGDPYKLDNIARAGGEVISFYEQGGFSDLCRGPHVPSTGRIGAVKVLSLAGAYWHGDAGQKQLTRVYGTAFPTREELESHLRRLEEAKRRDHRVLGRRLDIFSTQPEIGPGLILWHPNGAVIRHEVETFWREEHLKRGYRLIYTPHIASEEIYRRSGHLENYGEMMYSPMDIDGSPYRVKPMNCPGHILIYNSGIHSYRELPFRWCELGTVYRYEPSGTLHGMLRVRGFTQDDSHIFCTPDQAEDEINGVLDLMEHMMRTFGYRYRAFLATRPAKSIGSDSQWESATAALRAVLERRGMPYETDAGGGVFYGPKIDVKLVDALGREWQGPTTQLDFNLPGRFNVDYVGPDNGRHRAVLIHRTVLGSLERFVGGLLEHFAGDFPLWLAPLQVRVLTVTDAAIPHGRETAEQLRRAGLRVELDDRGGKIGAKIREGELLKIPCLLVVGEKEAESGRVSVRRRLAGDLGSRPVGELVAELADEIRERRLPPPGGGNQAAGK